MDRRLVGIDLGIASTHTVRVLREDGGEVCRRRAYPTVDSLTAVEQAALAGVAAGRGVLHRPRACGLPGVLGEGGRPAAVLLPAREVQRHRRGDPGPAAAGRPGRAAPAAAAGAAGAGRARPAGAGHRPADPGRGRTQDADQGPGPAVDAGQPADRRPGSGRPGVLARYADPNALLRLGKTRLTRLVATASNNHLGAERAEQWLTAAAEAVALYGTHPAVAYLDLAAEVATEVRLLRAIQAELAGHAQAREQAYRYADLGALVYHTQMVERGKDHLGAVCVVAAHLAERAWAVLSRGMPYVICDTDATPVSPARP